jgi:hypothetical protein
MKMEESERKNPRLNEEEGRREEGKRKGVRVMVKGGRTDIHEVRTSVFWSDASPEEKWVQTVSLRRGRKHRFFPRSNPLHRPVSASRE